MVHCGPPTMLVHLIHLGLKTYEIDQNLERQET